MKAADHWDAGSAQGLGQIVGAQDDVARAAGRTEQAKQAGVQNLEIANRPDAGDRPEQGAVLQSRWESGMRSFDDGYVSSHIKSP
jgi:hypothetical protein